MKLNELDPNKHVNVLTFGDSGAGKTIFAAGFPGPVHFFDFDLKVSSAAAFYKGKPELEEITYDQFPLDKDTLGDAGHKLNDELGKLKKLAKSGDFPYKTIVFDSLTTMSDRMMEYIMKENPGIKRNITKGAQAPALQDYGLFRIFMKRFIGEILSFPCNVVMTAHIEVKTDEQTGALLRQPMLTGKLAAELPIYFEEVYRAYVEGEGEKRKYMAQTQADRRFNCRSQRGLPASIELDYKNLITN